MKLLAKVLKLIPFSDSFVKYLILHWGFFPNHDDNKFRETVLLLSDSPVVPDVQKIVLKQYLWSSRLEFFKKCKHKQK